jgi:hypothetical protein
VLGDKNCQATIVVKQTTPTKKNEAKKRASPKEPTNHQPDMRPPRFFPHSLNSRLMVCSVFPDGHWVKGYRSQEAKSSQPIFSSPWADSLLELQAVIAARITVDFPFS